MCCFFFLTGVLFGIINEPLSYLCLGEGTRKSNILKNFFGVLLVVVFSVQFLSYCNLDYETKL